MGKHIITGPDKRTELPELLEGYLYGLGETCHQLFGAEGEKAMYMAVGQFFIRYLKDKMGIVVSEEDPWERYCRIIEIFTQHGFYTHIELNELDDGKHWMLEKNQYAGQIWEEAGSWQRGTAPCPLWALILTSLSEIGYTIVLDDVKYVPEMNGFESTFHFEQLEKQEDNLLDLARRKIISS